MSYRNPTERRKSTPISIFSRGGRGPTVGTLRRRVVGYTWRASIKSLKLLNLEFWSISVCYELIAIAINNRKGPSEWTFDIPKIENVNIQIGSFQFSWNFIWNSFHCLTHLLNSSSIVYSLHQDITDDQTIRVATMVTSLNSIRTKVQRALIEDSIISVLEFEDFFITDLMFLLIDSSVLEFTFHHSDIIRSMNQKFCYIDVGDFKLVTSKLLW